MIRDRDIDELLGFCRGIIADGVIVEAEGTALLRWIETNKGLVDVFPANRLYSRLKEMLRDGTLDPVEQGELIDTVVAIVRDSEPWSDMGHPVSDAGRAVHLSTKLPLTDPQPDIVFPGRFFCFTGRLAFDSRKNCELQVMNRGGKCQEFPTRETAYLVVGSIGSRDWKHSTFGRKIEAAVQLAKQGFGLAVVSEDTWRRAIERIP